MSTPRIYLADGHGDTPDGSHDPGAAGNGWTEQTATRLVNRAAARRLRALGARVRAESDQDRDPNYVGTTAAANDWPADVCVATHCDVRTAPTGSFAYHHQGSRDGSALARAIIGELTAHGRPTRPAWRGPRHGGFAPGPVTWRDLYVLRETTMPAVLLEVGPVGHATLDEAGELAAIGTLIGDGIARRLGLLDTDDAPDPATPPPPPPEPTSQHFADVTGPFGDAIDIAHAAGILEGCTDGTYRPAEPVTRGQLAEVIARLLTETSAPSGGDR